MSAPLKIQYELLPSDYGHAIAALSQEATARVDNTPLNKLADGVEIVALRFFVFIAIIAASIWLALLMGLTTPLGLIALLAIPLGIFLWLKIERFFRNISRKMDSAVDNYGAQEMTKHIEKGAVKVPLGHAVCSADSTGIRVDYLSPDHRTPPHQLPWSSIKVMVFGQKAAMISPSSIRSPQDMQQVIVIPLDRLPDSQQLVRSLQALRGH